MVLMILLFQVANPHYGYQATSNKANGFLWAIKSNVRAAPEGKRPLLPGYLAAVDTPVAAAQLVL